MTAATDEEPPPTLLASHPETAYFWGRVVGDGDVAGDCVTASASDETAARKLASIAGADRVDRHIIEREYAHDTAVTRTGEEYAVQVFGDLADRAGAALGLPVDSQPGGYRLDVFDDHRRQLLRGLLEGCGTVCFKRSSGTVGVSFVHDDRRALERVRALLDAAPVEAPVGELSATSSGGHWFGVADDAVPTVAEWVYDGSDSSGLFSPSRRRKLRRSLDAASAVDRR